MLVGAEFIIGFHSRAPRSSMLQNILSITGFVPDAPTGSNDWPSGRFGRE
jgi:hypothetical protein